MSRGVYMVFTSPANPEVEGTYNQWYDEVHLPDVTAIPGVVYGRRLRLSDYPGNMFGEVAGGHRYVAIYDVNGAEFAEIDAELAARIADGRVRMTRGLLARDPAPVGIFLDDC
jgi:hypothetical protein